LGDRQGAIPNSYLWLKTAIDRYAALAALAVVAPLMGVITRLSRWALTVYASAADGELGQKTGPWPNAARPSPVIWPNRPEWTSLSPGVTRLTILPR